MANKLLLAALFAGSALAKTDLSGCTSFETIITVSGRPDIYPYGSLIWYVPDTGELCEFLDCGGGRAPPKTTVPGCATYEGTETYSPQFIDPKTLGQAPQTAADDVSTGLPTGLINTTGNLETMPTVIETEASSGAQQTGSSEAAATSSGAAGSDSGSASLTITSKASGAKTSAASDATNSKAASSASDGAASSPAPTSSSVSTAAGAMPTAGGMLALAAGAAVYAGVI